ncbi:MAG TPA: AAA family ATPase [Bacteroidaceae bacterium]|nr:AAA family ATPase [Bacteroidaceae bacterium]
MKEYATKPEKMAQYISKIEIKAMWGRQHIVWNLHPDVNILSGVNGVGKSTILNTSINHLDLIGGGKIVNDASLGVNFEFYPNDATFIRYDVIRTIDQPLIYGNMPEKMIDRNVISELDLQLYKLQRQYLDYQVNIGNRTIELLTSGNGDKIKHAAEISKRKIQFMDFVDEMFADTNKKIIRGRNDILFEQHGEALLPYKLSSGEKQMLVILLTVLIQDLRYGVIFMDEPEASLHIEWQQHLIRRVREMNPNLQIILTTHSPAVIMDGWMYAVSEVSDITVN